MRRPRSQHAAACVPVSYTHLDVYKRQAYLGVAEYSLQYNLISAGTTLIVLALGVVLFSHTEKTFMDTV